MIKKKGKKLIAGPKWMPDTKKDWPTDHRPYYNFDLNLAYRVVV
jgi:hypothetical protein